MFDKYTTLRIEIELTAFGHSMTGKQQYQQIHQRNNAPQKK